MLKEGALARISCCSNGYMIECNNETAIINCCPIGSGDIVDLLFVFFIELVFS
jgi:hypothetical protein